MRPASAVGAETETRRPRHAPAGPLVRRRGAPHCGRCATAPVWACTLTQLLPAHTKTTSFAAAGPRYCRSVIARRRRAPPHAGLTAALFSPTPYVRTDSAPRSGRGPRSQRARRRSPRPRRAARRRSCAPRRRLCAAWRGVARVVRVRASSTTAGRLRLKVQCLPPLTEGAPRRRAAHVRALVRRELRHARDVACAGHTECA